MAGTEESDNSGLTQPASWVLLTFGTDRQYGGNVGYDDETTDSYRYDSIVANHLRVKEGDAAIVCDRQFVMGAALLTESKRRTGLRSFGRLESFPSTNPAPASQN